MHPAAHASGSSVPWIVLSIGGAIPCLYWLRALRLAREGAQPSVPPLVSASPGRGLFGAHAALIAANPRLCPACGVGTLISIQFLRPCHAPVPPRLDSS